MKTLSPFSSPSALRSTTRRAPASGFTLVELMAVIVIIGILAALVSGAIFAAKLFGTNATIKTELNQLEMACEHYKTEHGEYPPDFADISSTAGQQAVLRHLSRAFPRYVPGVSTPADTTDDGNWNGFVNDVSNATNGWNMDVTKLSPAGALTFWLGGKPVWLAGSGGTLADGSTTINPAKPVTAFNGFSANPLNPFDAGTSRTKPMYDFNLNTLRYVADGTNPGGIIFWPKNAFDANNTNHSPIVYFRNNNGTYFTESSDASTAVVKSCNLVCPAIDTRLSTVETALSGSNTTNTVSAITWINPQSFQIFCSGLDMTYGALQTATNTTPISLTSPASVTGTVLLFPSGANYVSTVTRDDVANFSNGKLEDSIPQ